MNNAELFRFWLIDEVGFRADQVEVRGSRSPDGAREIFVHFVDKKLHFIVDKHKIDCALARGPHGPHGQSWGSRFDIEYIVCMVHHWVDLRDPESFDIIGGSIRRICEDEGLF